jgi:hypothetical protein
MGVRLVDHQARNVPDGLLTRAAAAAGRDLVAAEDTLALLVGLIAVAWLVGWMLPRKAREMQ